jgi:RNA polymerase sigma-70 factor, ECF subfamily
MNIFASFIEKKGIYVTFWPESRYSCAMKNIDEGRFEELCAPQRQSLLAYLFTLCGDYHLAEDLVQDSLTIALSKREHYFPEADFGAWLRAIARNVWMRERQNLSRQPATSAIVEDLADEVFSSQRYNAHDWETERKSLRACIGELKADDRDMVAAHFKAGRKYSDIATAAGRTLSWVKVRMFRARKILADCVRRRLAELMGSN